MSYDAEEENQMQPALGAVPHEEPNSDSDSDAKSFHSAISSVTKPSSRCRSRRRLSYNNQSQPTIQTVEYLVQCQATPPSQPESLRRRSSCSQETTPSKKSAGSQASSHRSRKHSDAPTFTRRHSSLAQQNRPLPSRRDSAALHRQSCLLFSSLDGVLAPSSRHEITSLTSSFSSSPSTTRHASIVPEDVSVSLSPGDGGDSVRRFCASIDAKLVVEAQTRPDDYLYTYAHTHAHTLPGRGASLASLMTTSQTTPARLSQEGSPSGSAATFLSPAAETPDQQTPATLDTVMTWTSNASRRDEYAKIDRAHSGLRGLLRRAAPRRFCRRGRRGFFTGDCDGDSVRRFRVNVDDDDENASRYGNEDEAHDEQEEAEVTAVDPGDVYDEEKAVLRVLENVKGLGLTDKAHDNHVGVQAAKPTKKPRWLCFGSG